MPNSPADTFAAVIGALEVVRVRRSLPRADKVDGFVTGVGRRCVVLQELDPGMFLNGWIVLRQEDVVGVVRRGGADSFPVKALRLRGEHHRKRKRVFADRFCAKPLPSVDYDDVITKLSATEAPAKSEQTNEGYPPGKSPRSAVISLRSDGHTVPDARFPTGSSALANQSRASEMTSASESGSKY